MDIAYLKNKQIAVLGFGQEGKSIINYLVKHGIKPVLFDSRPWEEWDQSSQTELKEKTINLILGPGYLDELKGFNVIFRSPGIPLAKIEPYLKFNQQAIITSQTIYFFENCPAKIIGVTGTKGKGTTCSLIYEILKQEFGVKSNELRVYLTGNIGKIQPVDVLDDLKKDDWLVYELSSFQLQDLTISPHIGVVLMVTQEHLDYHANKAEYIEAKNSIVKYQTRNDFAVINADFKNSKKIGELSPGTKVYFSRNEKVAPGCFAADGKIYGIDLQGNEMEIISQDKLQLRGGHNLENICAAILASSLAGCNPEVIKKTIKQFKGLEYRLQLVYETGKIKFYNDSFSTTPETAIAAIKSFNEPEILILGGSSKGSDFTELGQTVIDSPNIKAVILTGAEGPKIKQAILQAGRPRFNFLEGAKNVEEIFNQIRPIASAGDAVVFSPGCASFDMFKNYSDRGEQFTKQAKNFTF